MSDFPFETVYLNHETAYLLDCFCCGNDEIDRYVKEDALNDNFLGKGVTYLVLEKKDKRLVSYYTLSSTSILYFEDQDISEKNSIDDLVIRGIPSIEIKMFAVSKTYQDFFYVDEKNQQNLLSDIILGSVIGSIYDIVINTIGAEMIVLHAVPEAVKFYRRNYFLPLDNYSSLYNEYNTGCTPMFMKLF